MKAMILAAGLGQRMRPLTDHFPKPLLPVAGKPLIQFHLEALAQAGVRDVVINLAYLGDKIRNFVGSGRKFGLRVEYSPETELLETGGGVLRALPLLGPEPFLLVNADVWSDFDFTALVKRSLNQAEQGHLIVVPNPDFHPYGDFLMDAEGYLTSEHPQASELGYTFAGISVLRPELISNYCERRQKFPLVEALRAAIAQHRVTAEVYEGRWSDVGTPGRLQSLDRLLTET